MGTDDEKIDTNEKPALIDATKDHAAREAGRAAALGALAAVETVATSALDAAERFFFGKVGGAEEAVAREAGVDPLDRVREAYGVEKPAEKAAAPKPDPVAEARRQLEELKRARDERKKTL